MNKTLIVIAANGDSCWQQSVDAAAEFGTKADIALVFTDNRVCGEKERESKATYWCSIPPVFPSGAYECAFRTWKEQYSNFLFLHDSTILKKGGLSAFRKACAKNGVVSWMTFPMMYDTPEQEAFVKIQYLDVTASEGIFGCIFFGTTQGLSQITWPRYPETKMEEQGNERSFALAFAQAGIPVASLHPLEWSNERIITDGFPELTKFLRGRQ